MQSLFEWSVESTFHSTDTSTMAMEYLHARIKNIVFGRTMEDLIAYKSESKSAVRLKIMMFPELHTLLPFEVPFPCDTHSKSSRY